MQISGTGIISGTGLDIVVENADGVAILLIVGRLVKETAEHVRRVLESMVATGHTMLVIDLGGVSMLDPSGLASVTATVDAARRRGADVMILPPCGSAATQTPARAGARS